MTTKTIFNGLVLSFLLTLTTFAQQHQTPTTDTAQKMSVAERMAKARAAKTEKNSAKPTLKPDNTAKSSYTSGQKAVPADYKAPVDKTQKGPNGDVVHTGERGGKYYINKNGNKTYLSSNQ